MYEKLFDYIRQGFKFEKEKQLQHESLEEFGLYLMRIHNDDINSAYQTAFYAGRLMALFGIPHTLRVEISDNEFDQRETELADNQERLLNENFATTWKNAMYLWDLGKGRIKNNE